MRGKRSKRRRQEVPHFADSGAVVANCKLRTPKLTECRVSHRNSSAAEPSVKLSSRGYCS
ncbi:hypothetical protein ACFPRL_10945 [Pseudoclavibacter helvolus]